MTASIPTTEPTEVVAGDTWRWNRGQSSDYSIADGWSLSYAFRGVNELDLGAAEVAENGDTYEITVPATATGRLGAGAYKWAAYVTKGSERYRIDAGTVRVFEDLATAEPALSFEECELVLVEAAILDITGAGTTTYSFNGRTATKVDLPLLHKRRNALLWKIRQRQTGQFSRRIEVGFGA